MLASLKEDFRGTLQALKGFVPKELDIDMTVQDVTPEQWLSNMGKNVTNQNFTTVDQVSQIESDEHLQ